MLGVSPPGAAAMRGVDWPVARLSANVSTLYAGLPVRERPAAAARDGFRWMESWWPFAPDETPPEEDVASFARTVRDSRLGVASLNFSSGARAAGERGLPAVRDGAARLRAHVPVALGLAERVGCRLMNLQYGRRDPAIPLAEQRTRADAAVAELAVAARERGVDVMLEPLGEADAPGYLLRTVDDALRVCDAVEAATGVAVGVCFDVFQLSAHEPDLAAAFVRARDRIRHVQLADSPGRSVPGAGGIDFPRILEALRSTGYRGFVGLEYSPDPSG